MSVFLDARRWKEVLSDFEIVDIAIQEKGILQLCARKRILAEEASHGWDADIPTRIVSVFTERPTGDNCGFQDLDGMHYPVVGVSRAPFERPGGLISSKNSDGDTWPRGGGSGPMEYIAPGAWPHPHRLKCINGYTYSVGAGRSLHKRVAVGKWLPFMHGIPHEESTNNQGFKDLDAFSESDMYAVGGHGDVWHYDGTAWRKMGFPSSLPLGTVTCAGDGNVYISGEGGSLWVGQESTWTHLYRGGASVLWNDVLWFQGRLWLASDYQLRVWNGKELEDVAHKGERINMAGHMDVHDGLLAVASLQFVMTFDGREWRQIVAPYSD